MKGEQVFAPQGRQLFAQGEVDQSDESGFTNKTALYLDYLSRKQCIHKSPPEERAKWANWKFIDYLLAHYLAVFSSYNLTQKQLLDREQYVFTFVHETQQFEFKLQYLKQISKDKYILDNLRLQSGVKWTHQQRYDYETFILDLLYFDQLFAMRQVFDYSIFLQVRQSYIECCPEIYKLYEDQFSYYKKNFLGLKEEKAKVQTQVQETKKIEAAPKQIVVVRKTDADNNLPEILNQFKWDEKTITKEVFIKENANIVFVGHVDSGKSTLTGNILKELNQVDEQEWLKCKADSAANQMESWELAGIADVDPLERQKGKTIQCAKVFFSLAKRRFTLFDAPGHKNYIPNMMMGACQADIAVLIISAKEGEFESGFEKAGQSKEHAVLAKALGAYQLVVAVTKMGTVNWAKRRYDHIVEQVTPFLEQFCNYRNVSFIPVDSLNNENIHSPVKVDWYKGPFLLNVLESMAIPERKSKGPIRMPIIDKFVDSGTCFIYGKIESGNIVEDQTVSILPHRSYVICKEFYNAKDVRIPYAAAGENVKIKVKFIDNVDINRGDMICSNLNFCQESREIIAKITVTDIPEKKKLMASGYQCVVHIHAVEIQAAIESIKEKEDKTTKKMVPAKFLVPGETGHVVLSFKSVICLQKYEFMEGLGRFTIRDEGKTVGYGQVIKIKPAKTLMKEQKEQLLVKDAAQGSTEAPPVQGMSELSVN